MVLPIHPSIDLEPPFYAKECSECWGFSHEQSPFPGGVYILVAGTDNKQINMHAMDKNNSM